MFNIVDGAHAHYADFAVICIHGDSLLFVFVSRVATWVFKLQYGKSLKTSDLSSNRKEIGQSVSEIVISPNPTTFSDWRRMCHVPWVNSLGRTKLTDSSGKQ